MASNAMTDPTAGKKDTMHWLRGDLARRVATGAVALPLLVWAAVSSPAMVWVLLAVVAAGGAWELTALMLRPEGESAAPKWTHALSAVLAAALVMVVALGSGTVWMLPALTGLGMAVALVGLSRSQSVDNPAAHAGASAAALLMVALPVALLGMLRAEAGASWLAVAFAVTWFGDAGAYFTGRAFGKRKLAPRTSPNKTIEGSLGGLVVAAALAVGLFAWLEPQIALWQVLVVAIPANILGQSGDLWESALKRRAGVKDSGTMIPGYGGMLDKFDSLFLAAPWLYACHLWLSV